MDKFCKECSCKPCQCKRINKARKRGQTNCEICGVKLIERGGYGGLDMCGPCVTGDSDTIDEV